MNQTYNEIVNGFLNSSNVVANVYKNGQNIDLNNNVSNFMADFGFTYIKRDKHYKIYTQKYTKKRHNRLIDALKNKHFYIKFNRVDGHEDDVNIYVRFNRINGYADDAIVTKQQMLEYLNNH